LAGVHSASVHVHGPCFAEGWVDLLGRLMGKGQG
jgi:hypothetical protein